MTPNSENKRVWFITGASKGLGYAFTCAALKAGDKVVADRTHKLRFPAGAGYGEVG